MLKYTLLGFLNYKPMTGYELKQSIDHSIQYFWHAKLSQIYVTLKSMETEQLVQSEVSTSPEGRERRIYTITPAGAQELQHWLARPLTELDERKETLLLKLFFSARQDKAVLLTQLRLQRELHILQANLYRQETAQAIRETAGQNPQLARDAVLWDATRRFGELFEELYIRWLDETIATVQEKL